MKKAKRLLAVLMAAVMLITASSLPSYAWTEANNYFAPNESRNKYYFTYAQGAGYVLDMLDEMLAEGNMTMTCDELNEMVGIGINIFTGDFWGINLDDRLEDAGNPKGLLDLTSVDGLIRSLYALLDTLENSSTAALGELLGLFGDLLDEEVGLTSEGLILAQQRQYVEDTVVLEMLVNWINNQSPLLQNLLAGTLDWGSLLGDLVEDLLSDNLGISVSGGNLSNMDIVLKTLVYQLLTGDETVTEIPAGVTVDSVVQDLIDMALITGTGNSIETGAASLLGENFEPLMPAIANQPGGASITPVAIQADRNGDGVTENVTMNTYQFVANLLKALMDGMLGPMLAELLYDALEIEITEDYPYGDPAIMQDQMFAMIVGLVESLLVQNGAPEPEYTEDENTYPVLKIDAMIDWLFNGGGLDTFIKIDYLGIQIQDNFMSLLNDLIRLLVNMLPSLGLFESSAHLGYEASELNAVWYYNENFELVAEDAEGAVDQTYVTYETGEIIYATEYQTINEVKTATAYNYMSNKMPVNISDSSASDYVNPDFVRLNYVVSTNQVYATVIKMALNDMIEGCYFPEWTTDIPSVLAYGMAGLAAPAVPANDYYRRLDAYHEMMETGLTVYDDGNNAIDAIPYAEVQTFTNSAGESVTVTVPTAAIDIGCSYLAAYLNTLLMVDYNLSTDTTFEQFLTEFLVWALREYMPVLIGTDGGSNNIYGDGSGEKSGAWTAEFNTLIAATYTNLAKGDINESADFGVIYDFLDATLLALIPTSWLPAIKGSEQLIKDWLLGNLIEFDLQGILGLLQVNTDPNAELGNLALLPLIIRVLDRILALVFNDHGLLLVDGRQNVMAGGNNTSITTLDALLSCKVNGAASTAASLPVFIKNLLGYLNTYKTEILSTALPLIVGGFYERPYDTAYLGTDMNVYKIQDLEDYIDSFTLNINAEPGKTYDNEDDANAAVDGTATIKRTVTTTGDGTQTTLYNIELSTGTIYGSYATRSEAEAVLDQLSDAYVHTEVIDEKAGTAKYTIYFRDSYLDTATASVVENDAEDGKHDGGNYTTYSGFQFADLTGRTSSDPFARYESNQQYYFAYEDFGNVGYFYSGVNDAIDEADSYVGAYKSFAEGGTLSDAYGSWLMYSIEARLQAADLYDANDDGRSVLSDTDSDYVADTYPVDGNPDIPTAIYPFYSTNTSAYSYKDGMTGETISVAMNSFNATEYEQLAMAVAYGDDAENNVQLSTMDAEKVVRLALGTLAFDITPHADGTYNAGSAQWETLTDTQLSTISTFCANNNMLLEYDEEAATYVISRASFNLLDSNFNLGVSGAAVTPVLDSQIGSYTSIKSDDRTYAQELVIQLYSSYKEYIETMYANRRSVYNMIDLISYRYETAEANRKTATDITMLQWAIDLSKSAYKSEDQLRNWVGSGSIDLNTGEEILTKVYTAGSFAKFRVAYDMATSLVDISKTNIQDANEITQSLITEAYYGLLEAFFNLIPFTGDADWTQLDAYIQTAYDILTDENKNDPVLGYASGLEFLEATYGEATSLRTNTEVDCERQAEVDDMAAALRQAILQLTYITAPSLGLPESSTAGIVVTSEEGANRIQGQVFGLEEGVGAIMDLVEIIGMRVEGEDAGSVTITGSGLGTGTGAYYRGVVRSVERFRYYAVVYGDINGDTRVDGTDVSTIEYYKAMGTLDADNMGAAEYEAADANHDGQVDQVDIDTIINHYTFISKIDQKSHSTTIISA